MTKLGVRNLYLMPTLTFAPPETEIAAFHEVVFPGFRQARLPRQGVQHIDRVAHIQPLSEPARDCCPRVETEPLRVVPRSQDLDRIGGHRSGRGNFGQEPAVRSPEAKLSIGLSIHLVALFVNRAVVPTTEQGEVRERRGAAVRPVADVMPLTKREPFSAACWQTKQLWA